MIEIKQTAPTTVIIHKKDIRKQSLQEIKDFLVQQGEQAFRAKQIYEWLWKKSAFSFDQMTNLSVGLRHKLSEHFVINAVAVDKNKLVQMEPLNLLSNCLIRIW
jgi:23S rRNA (adenine2503-C2)-methyltransferase